MKILRFSILALVGLLAICFCGCGTTVNHTSYFAAANPQTKNRNYFRVAVSARTDNGKCTWQTGWYSRKALDQIFSEITTNGTPAVDQMVGMYEDALVSLMAKYTNGLLNMNTNVMRDAKDGLDDLFAVAQYYMSAGATPKDAAENAGKRFVYSFTADPTLLQRLISDAIDSEEISASVSSLVIANSPDYRESQQLKGQLTAVRKENDELARILGEATAEAANAITNFASLNPIEKKGVIDRITTLLNAAASQ